MDIIEFVEKVLDTLRDMDNGIDVICNLDAKVVVEKMEVANIVILKGATNGDMIKAMLPNIEVKPNMEYGIKMGVRVIAHIDEHTIFELWFPTQWWDAPYKKEVKE